MVIYNCYHINHANFKQEGTNTLFPTLAFRRGKFIPWATKGIFCTIQSSQFLAHRIIPQQKKFGDVYQRPTGSMHPFGKQKKLRLEKRELTLYIMLRAPPFSLKDPFMVALALSKSVLMQRRKWSDGLRRGGQGKPESAKNWKKETRH